MRQIKRSAEYELTHRPGGATYEQCQLVWSLMKALEMEPVWIQDLPYAQAVRLITTLRCLTFEKSKML